jgi:glc operon protein GlcG
MTRKIIKHTIASAALALLFTTRFAVASPLPTTPVLTLEAAQTVVGAAEQTAQANGWPCVIAVVDADGLPITLIRMDNAAVPGGVVLAPGKARTAALLRRPTSVLEDAINSGKRPALETAGAGLVMMSGGIPLIADGQIVGAIGVSSDTPAHDEIIAKAGVAALKQ